MTAAALSGQDLSIQLLGRLEVRRGAEPSALPASKKSRALLAYLVATARPHLRERLCELLWEVPDDPRASLRWSLAKLRPLVDDGPTVRLVGNRDELVFESHGARVDVVELRDELGAGPEAASIESLRRAALLFRGEFLEGLDLTGCYRYHEWWIAEREKTRATRLAILGQLIARLHDMPEEALEYARQRLALDSLAESAHLDVIRLLGAMGRTREAIAQYDRCKRLLLAELGAEPSAELLAMRVGLSARATAPRPASVPPAAPEPAAPPSRQTLPFVGRLRELERARAVIEEAASGREHPALQVIGEPGIGKTRLLEEFGRIVRARAGVLLSGRAFEAEAVRPYGPFIDALRSVALPELPIDVAHDLRPLLPELPHGSPSESSPSSGHSNRSFDAVTRALPLIGKAGVPVLVVLDDIQWFDEASAALLHFAVRALSRSPVLFALGVRPAELHDNPTVMRVLKSLARERRIEQLALLPLDAGETQELVAAAVHGADASRVYAGSEGNPFFCLEIARALEAGEDPLSRSLEDLIGDRFDRLGPTAAQLLTWAAALGRSFPSDLLGKVVPVPAADLVAGIEELLRRGILLSVPSAPLITTSPTICSARPPTDRRPRRAASSCTPRSRACFPSCPMRTASSPPTSRITPLWVATTSCVLALVLPQGKDAFGCSPTSRHRRSPIAVANGSTVSPPRFASHCKWASCASASSRAGGVFARARSRASSRERS
jgi:DNA-binding SARP family transcriptional activator